MKILDSIHKATPLTDKILALVGGGVAGTLTLAHVNAIVGICVGLLTALVLIPRAVLAWRDLLRKMREGGEDEDE